jgi:hypothetical protein
MRRIIVALRRASLEHAAQVEGAIFRCLICSAYGRRYLPSVVVDRMLDWDSVQCLSEQETPYIL